VRSAGLVVPWGDMAVAKGDSGPPTPKKQPSRKKQSSREKPPAATAQIAKLEKALQDELQEMRSLRQDLEAKLQALDEFMPGLTELPKALDKLSRHVEQLMAEKAEEEQQLRETLPKPVHPNVTSRPSLGDVESCWQRGSAPQVIGMETDPRDPGIEVPLPQARED